MRRNFLLPALAIMISSSAFAQGVKIGDAAGNPDPSAMLEVDSGDKGFLPPRIADPSTIVNPANGLMVLNTTTNCLQIFLSPAGWQNMYCGCSFPATPAEGSHSATLTSITWHWGVSVGAAGYKWNTADDYSSATDIANATTLNQTELTCNTGYTLYVWAYNDCGPSESVVLNESTGSNFQVDTNCTLTNGLIAYYKLENTSDSWGSYHLTNVNSATFTSGKVNNCVDQNSSAHLRTGSGAGSIINGGAISLSAWVNINAQLGNNSSYVFVVQTTGSNHVSYFLYYDSDGAGNKRVGFVRDRLCNGGTHVTVPLTLNPGTWYHLTGTYDGTNITLWVDGEIGSGPTPALSGNGSCHPEEIEIGGRVSNSTSPYNGKVDEFGIWNRALTQQEVEDLYNNGTGQTLQ